MSEETKILKTVEEIHDLVSKHTQWKHSLILVIVTAIIGIVGTITGSYFTYHFNLNSQQKIHNQQLRQKTYGELMGLKIMISQLYISRFEALIYSDYHEQKWKLQSDYTKDSIDLQEAKRWMHKSENMVMEITENNSKLFNLIGVIQTLYPATPELNELIAEIYNFKSPTIKRNASAYKFKLDAWKEKAMSDLHKVVEESRTKPIDNLIKYLTSKVNLDE